MKRSVPVVAAVLIALFVGTQIPVEPTGAQDEAKPKPAATKKVAKKPRGRLPNFYAKVVDETQRKAIYAVQAKYSEEIGVLGKQIDELTAKRDTEVRAVLSEEQQKEIDALSEAARKKAEENRKKKKTKAS
jgi:hypothetical protein